MNRDLDFWSFCNARVGAVHDNVVSAHKFTNLHRLLDRNTQFMLALPHAWQCNSGVLFWSCTNNRQFFNFAQERGFLATPAAAWSELDELLPLARAAKQSVFSRCYQTPSQRGADTYGSFLYAMRDLRGNICAEVRASTSVFKLAMQLMQFPLLGKFFAYQMAQNFSYLHENAHLNIDQALYGPGALAGLRAIKLRGEIVDLAQQHDNFCAPIITMQNGENLQMYMLESCYEHALCEYSKYLNLKRLVKYKPSILGKIKSFVIPPHYVVAYRAISAKDL